MHSLLHKLFEKRGIKDATELSPEEKASFEVWNGVLSQDPLSLENIKQFCINQLEVIENKWSNLDVGQERKAELIPYHTVYKLFLLAIDAPKVARENLEKQLEQLLK